MKNYLFLLLLCPFLIFAQDNENSSDDPYDGYKQWHLELGVGGVKAAQAHTGAPGYPVPSPIGNLSSNTALLSGYNFNAGIRYMFNDKFGLRLKGGYNSWENDPDVSNFPATSSYIQTSLEAVLNVGNYMDFRNWSNRFNLQFYAGMGYGIFMPDNDNIDRFLSGQADENDGVFNAVLGFAPMYKISDNISLKLDFQALGTFGQQLNWDGASSVNTTAVDGLLFNLSFGVDIALGKGSNGSIDWYYKDDSAEMNALRDELNDLEGRVATLENAEPEDNDGDGVPDVINNYVQNYVQDQLDNFEVGGTVTSMVEDGYMRVFFDFNKDMPNTASTSDLASLVHFLQNNPDAKVELIGTTDVLGSDSYNDALSQRRAKNVHDILVEAGIDASRLEHRGGGKNDVYTSKNEYVRMLARTVTVKLQ
jgi:OOP family OmpA-OmpF porin